MGALSVRKFSLSEVTSDALLKAMMAVSPFLIALPEPQSLKYNFEQDSHITHHLGKVVFFLGDYVEKHVEACPPPGHPGERGQVGLRKHHYEQW